MTWNKFDSEIDEFIEFITRHNFFDNSVILALKTGGFTSAITLSNKTGIPISIVSYDIKEDGSKNPIFLEPELIKPDCKFIIPRDIYNHGTTVENVITALIKDFGIGLNKIMGLFHYATDRVYKTEMEFYRIINPKEENWVVYPWEKKVFV